MRNEIECINNVDADGNPAGGRVSGCGMGLRWQNGPLGRGDDRKGPNGVFAEDALCAVKQRLEFCQEVQEGKFKCDENQMAIAGIDAALAALDARTRDREARGVEGEHEA